MAGADDGGEEPAGGPIDLYLTDPLAAKAIGEAGLARAEAALVLGRTMERYDALCEALRALGLAHRELDDLERAEALLTRAMALAHEAGLTRREGEARLSLALVLAYRGRAGEGLRVLKPAGRLLDDLGRARVAAQRAMILLLLGRTDEACAALADALVRFRAAASDTDLVMVLVNRAIVLADLGRLDDAEADLVEARTLCEAAGFRRTLTEVVDQLGQIAGRRGDVPAALAFYAEADILLDAHSTAAQALVEEAERDPMAHVLRSELLLSVPLVDEALVHARLAVAAWERADHPSYLNKARLLLAEAALAAGDLATAREQGAAVLRSTGTGRGATEKARAGLARFVLLRVAWAEGPPTAAVLAAARRTTAALVEGGLAIPTVESRIIAGRIALEFGRPDEARAELRAASRALATGTGPAGLRARLWHAEALARLSEDDRQGARRALRSGLEIVDRYQASMGATELRTSAGWHASDLANVGTRLALEDRRPAELWTWTERARAGALRLPPVRPPGDEALAAALADLRAVRSELDEAAAEGRSTERLQRRLASLEDVIRRVARQGAGSSLQGERAIPPHDVHAALGPERALVELLECDGFLHALCLAGGRITCHSLGPTTAADALAGAMRFGLRRLAHGRGSRAALAQATETVARAGAGLDALILGPMRRRIRDRTLVLVPTGRLHSAPWPALPSLAGRPLSVAPSAAIWHRAAVQESPVAVAAVGAISRALLVAGPGLQHAEAEIASLAGAYPDAIVLDGAAATTAATASALDGAGLAHVACHGHFRSDHPMFSSLSLADGPLTVYDLERLKAAPTTLVLSACESGLSEIRPGDEVMGLSAALFSLGTRALIASVAPVPDHTTRRLMLDFHANLTKGGGPAAALAAAQRTPTDAAFLCLGAG